MAQLLSLKIISEKQHWPKTRLAIRTLLQNISQRSWNKAESLHVKFQKYLQSVAAHNVTQGKGLFGSCLPNCFSRAGKLSAKLWQKGKQNKSQSWRHYASENLFPQRLIYINLLKHQDDVWHSRTRPRTTWCQRWLAISSGAVLWTHRTHVCQLPACFMPWAAQLRQDARRSVAVCTWRRQLLSWSLIPMQNGDVSPQLSHAASLSPGSSLKYVRKTPGAMKSSWSGPTPVALEPWHSWRKVSGQALW